MRLALEMRKRQTLRLMLQLTLVLRETLRLRLRSTVALTLRLRLHSPYIEPSPTLTDITAINPRYVSKLFNIIISLVLHIGSSEVRNSQCSDSQFRLN